MSSSKLVAPELATVEIHGMTRASFMLRGAIAAGAALGAGAVAPFVGGALAQSGGGDVAVLNFALTLEYLETDFYANKAKAVGLSGAAKKLAAEFASQEAAHVDALTKAIQGAGGNPAAKPAFKFPVTNEAGFLKLAYVLENTGVSAYNGAAGLIANPDYLAAAGSIVQVEARHAASIALLTGQAVTPDGGFDRPLTMAQVLPKVKPLIA